MSKPIIEGKERRAVSIEIRMDGMGEGETPMIRGHAAVFDSPSELLCGCFREVIKPGAFADALKTSDVRALFNHEPDNILGRTTADPATLRLKEDDTGLAIEIDPPDTTCGRDLQVSMKRGDIREMSFGFTVAEDGQEWTRDPDGSGNWTRTITKIERLYDVSPVTYPAYPETDCAMRSLEKVQAAAAPPVENNNTLYRMKFDLAAS
jgi:HK97 family phage prohead protease